MEFDLLCAGNTAHPRNWKEFLFCSAPPSVLTCTLRPLPEWLWNKSRNISLESHLAESPEAEWGISSQTAQRQTMCCSPNQCCVEIHDLQYVKGHGEDILRCCSYKDDRDVISVRLNNIAKPNTSHDSLSLEPESTVNGLHLTGSMGRSSLILHCELYKESAGAHPISAGSFQQQRFPALIVMKDTQVFPNA